MDRKSMTSRLSLLLLLGFAMSAPLELAAQVPVDENGAPLVALDDEGLADEGLADEALAEIPPMTAAELEELVGPVALYPDDLLAIVLPASTYPLEIVQAVRFLDKFEVDGSLEPDESWDESVVALLNYPEVVRMMDSEIDWTWRLGEAVISQQADVITAVESFRDRAYAAGNLKTDDYQTVSKDDGIIEIDPVDEEIIYVPYYEPQEVVVYQPRRRVYYYYPQAYPVYYYPYPYGHTFASGYFWGVTTAFTIGWYNHYLHVHHPSYWGHPYYGHHYYGHYYRRPSISVYNSWYVHNSYRASTHHHRDGDHWRPRYRSSGARPATQSVRNHYYPPGSSDRNRFDSRSSRRTRLDIQDSSRGSRDRIRATGSGDDVRTPVSANNDRRANEARRSSSGTRFRTGGSNRTADRLQPGNSSSGRENGAGASGRSEIRFRDRSAADTVRANRNSDAVRGNRSSGNSGASTRSSQQRLVAQNSRDRASATRVNHNRQASQRVVPARQPAASNTSSRGSASPRQSSQRPAARPAVQRQAPSQRPASRPAVQRQAPVQRAAPAAAPQRQAAPRQAAPSGSQPRARPQRKQSSSRGNTRQQHRQ